MEKVLGIDVGAWGASVAATVDGEVRVFTGTGSSTRIPAAVSVDDQGAVFVADAARRRAVFEPYNSVVTPLRLLGRFPSDESVRRAVALSPVRVVPGPAGHATLNLGEAIYAVPEIIAQLLGYLRAVAEQELGETVTKAVLAVPLSFIDAQRQALVLAARLAGLDVLRLLSSPMAGLLGQRRRPKQRERCLVVDAGGSHTSVGIIDVNGPICEVVGLDSDTTRGALDIDAALCEFLISDFERTHGPELQGNLSSRARLLFATENAKRSLLQHEQVRIRLREFLKTGGGTVDFDSFLDRTTLEQFAQPYAESILILADEAMTRAGAAPDSIDRLLVFGGGAALAAVPREVGALCSRDVEVVDDPDSVAARGAAIYGAALIGNPSMAVEEISVLAIEAVPADVSIATSGGYREVIIPSGARLPIAAHRIFTTSQDEQTQVRMLIFQGADGGTGSESKLGEFVLDGLKSAGRGEVCIDVGFELDRDGLLHVSARDLESGHRTASDVRISLAVAEQALASVRQARGMKEDTLKNPIRGRAAQASAPLAPGGERS